MENADVISMIVGRTAGLFPSEMADILDRTGVTIDAKNMDTDRLVDAIFAGLSSSVAFKKEFTSFVEANTDVI